MLGYFDLPADEIPVFTAVYFSDPDSQGHVFGPDHAAITEAVAHLDDVLARLIEGLEKRGVFQEVHIVVVGDHGMAAVCDEKFVYLEDLKPWVDIPENWVQSKYQLLSIRPDKDNVNLEEVVLRMNKGLSSGKVENGQRLRVYLKEDLPKRLHYSDSDRVCPIIGIVEEGYTVEINRRKGLKCGGEHGYDNELFSMRSIFIGHGPRFEKGKKINSFVNVEIYNLLVNILGLNGASNDGSDSFANDVLLPYT